MPSSAALDVDRALIRASLSVVVVIRDHVAWPIVGRVVVVVATTPIVTSFPLVSLTVISMVLTMRRRSKEGIGM